jgi:hypothetical protein
MSTRRKRCLVKEMKTVVVSQRGVPSYKTTSWYPCDGKIKPGTPFCRAHFETHKLIEVQCIGEAHKNPFIDHCMVCLPHWGKYPWAVRKDYVGPEPEWKGAW